MNSFFAHPWGLLGLAIAPVLVAIYLLRRKHRRIPVSALFLWNFAQPPRKGGIRVQRTPFPPVFFLELATLILLTLAAADPLLRMGVAGRELFVVFDACVAMQAPGANGEPTVELARQRLRREARAEPWRRLRVIEAASQPRIRADATEAAQVEAQMADFTPYAAHRDLTPALALAGRLAGPNDLVLVLTDRPPPDPPEDPRLLWVALGAPVSNLAIVDALRGADAGSGEECLAEIANFSGQPRAIVLFMDQADRSAEVAALTLDADARHRVRLPVPDSTAPLVLRLEPQDDFSLDNRVTLCPEPRMPVNVAVRARADSLRTRLLLKALAASGRAAMPERGVTNAFVPQLVFREAAANEEQVLAAPWTVVFHTPPAPRPFAGPFLRRSRHPLLAELQFDGVFWGAQAGFALPGDPLLSLPDGTPLVTEVEGPVLHIQWAVEQSTLQQTPDWPILVDNLLAWRAESLPAGQPRNMPLGARAVWESPVDASVFVQKPDGSRERLPASDGVNVFEPGEPGLYRIELPDDRILQLGVHLQAPATSDLRARAAGQWGERLSVESRLATSKSSAWLFLQAALILFAVHAAMVIKGVGL